jgi:putative salt-induced outer membrane protein YdiY
MFRFFKYTFFLLLCVLISKHLCADELVLSDGSVLNGTIVSVDHESVHLNHEILGELTIDRIHVQSLHTDEKVACKLPGDVVAIQPLVVGLGRGMRGIDELETMWLPEEKDPDVIAYEEEVERNRRKWSITLGVNFNGDRGNSTEDKYGINATAILKGPNDRLKLYAKLDESAYEDTKTADESIIGASYNRSFGGGLGLYVRSELERDFFESLDIRSTSASGFTYSFFDDDEEGLSLLGRLGFSYRYEDYITDEYATFPGGDVGYELEWKVFDWLNVVHEVSFLPSFEDFRDFVINHNSAMEIPLSSERHWFLQLGIKNDYNNVPTEGDEKMDTNYYTRLILKWE